MIHTSESHRKTIALLGVTKNTDNYGVRVLLSSCVDALAKAHPDADFIVLDYGYQPDSWIEQTSVGPKSIVLAPLRFSWRLYLPNNILRLLLVALISRWLPSGLRDRIRNNNPSLRRIVELDSCYAISGGDSFSDIYGLRRFAYVTLPQLLVLALDSPLVLLPQTHGPFSSWLARWAARLTYRRACTVMTRDAEGIDAVREVVGSAMFPVRLVPDLGLGMSPGELNASVVDQIRALRPESGLVGLNVSSLLYMGGYTGRNMFNLREPFPELVDALVECLVRRLDASVLLIPHVCGPEHSQEDETRLCKRLQKKYEAIYPGKVHYIDSYFDHRQMKALIGECAMFLGARMHACIAAASQAVPAVCLAYSKKFKGVMEPLGEGACVVDLRTATLAEVLQSTEKTYSQRVVLRSDLRNRAQGIRSRIAAEFAGNGRSESEQHADAGAVCA